MGSLGKGHGSDRPLPGQSRVAGLAVLLFVYPCIVLILFSANATTRYWHGHWPGYAILALMVWIAINLWAVTETFIHAMTGMITMLLLPAFVILIMCQLSWMQLQDTAPLLSASDCTSLAPKAHLNEAWIAANQLLVTCAEDLANLTGAPVEEKRQITVLSSCQEYKRKLDTWEREWTYLERLEVDSGCGGFCAPGRPIWGLAPGVQDKCADAAALEMRGTMSTMSMQLTVYASVVFLNIILIFIFAPHLLL
mmetsp:Transcript_24050/g.55542  ORF Transcript_24050/g.55542 Transcript_24050/m.55542 type:complete len:252 (+) Transcript_24050:148-903(+)